MAHLLVEVGIGEGVGGELVAEKVVNDFLGVDDGVEHGGGRAARLVKVFGSGWENPMVFTRMPLYVASHVKRSSYLQIAFIGNIRSKI